MFGAAYAPTLTPRPKFFWHCILRNAI